MQAPGLVTINDNLLMEKLFPISNQMIYPETHLIVCSWLPTCLLSSQSLILICFPLASQKMFVKNKTNKSKHRFN